MNCHVGRENLHFQNFHGGEGYGTHKREGERFLQMVEEFNLVIANTIFEKKDEYLITFKSDNNKTQIDYLVARRENRQEIINCKIISGESAVTQHSLLVTDLRTQ